MTARRELFHTRTVTCTGYSRPDGLWDIEGRVVDTRTFPSIVEATKRIPPGEPVHDLGVRITVDDRFVIREATAVIQASPFSCCGLVGPSYAKLVGLRLTAGFTAAVRERLGGPAGCTHLTELLSPMATTAIQTIAGGRTWRDQRRAAAPSLTDRAGLLDSCYALRADGEVARRTRAAAEAEAEAEATGGKRDG